VLLWGMLFRSSFSCLEFIFMGEGSIFIFIPLVKGSMRKWMRFNFGGSLSGISDNWLFYVDAERPV
jgi:hypothetical protein